MYRHGQHNLSDDSSELDVLLKQIILLKVRAGHTFSVLQTVRLNENDGPFQLSDL